MSSVIISIDDDSIEPTQDARDALAALLDPPCSPDDDRTDDDRVDPADIQEVLDTLPTTRSRSAGPLITPIGNAAIPVQSVEARRSV